MHWYYCLKYGSTLTTKSFSKNKTNLSLQINLLRVCRHWFEGVELDLGGREDRIVDVANDSSMLKRNCVTTFETAIGILRLVMIKAAHTPFWQSESTVWEYNEDKRFERACTDW